MSNTEPIFVELASESDDPQITQIESLCMKCKGKGITKLLLTKIPHYKEIIVTSFECNDCGDKNNGIQTSSIQECGIKYELKVEKCEDLSRQIVKSDYAALKIPDLDFEIPADGQKGEITTVEGVILKAISGLNQEQEIRKQTNIELYEQIQAFIGKLENLLLCQKPFLFVVDDPSGNSFVENPVAPNADPQLTRTTYRRTLEESRSLGFHKPEDHEEHSSTSSSHAGAGRGHEGNEIDNIKEEVLQFNTVCDQCSRPSKTKMKVTNIPHFKEVVIMASECDFCGYKTNEVKSGGGIEKYGKKYTLLIKHPEDLSRDVLKSETCSINIPELELEVGAGVFVGKFTTVEGLLNDIKDDMLKNPFLLGDAASSEKKAKIENLTEEIQKILDRHTEAHLILDDPAGNSFIQDLFTPDKDPFLEVKEYERSFEQNEELGLNDMKTENYLENDV